MVQRDCIVDIIHTLRKFLTHFALIMPRNDSVMSISVRIQPPLREFNFHSINLGGSVCSVHNGALIACKYHWCRRPSAQWQFALMRIVVARTSLILLIEVSDGASNGVQRAREIERERVRGRTCACKSMSEKCMSPLAIRCEVHVLTIRRKCTNWRTRRPLAPALEHANRILHTRAHTSILTDDNINRVMYSAFKVSTSQFILASGAQRHARIVFSSHMCGMAYAVPVLWRLGGCGCGALHKWFYMEMRNQTRNDFHT